MPDHIPELDRLAASGKEVPMLPATEIRRRGDRRRVTRRIATGTGICALALTAGFGIVQSPLLDGLRDNPSWANTPDPVPTPSPTDPAPTPEPTDPSPTDTPTPTQSPVRDLSWETVPGVEAFFPADFLDAGRVHSERTELGDGKGLCDPGAVGDPEAVRVRAIAGVDNTDPFGWATVLQYRSVAEATDAFETIRDAALDCGDQARDRGLLDPGFNDLTAAVPFDAAAVDADPVTMAYLTGMGLLPDSDEGIFASTVVLQAGDRVLWLAEEVQGMDYNCGPAPDNDAGQCSMPAALEQAAQNLLR